MNSNSRSTRLINEKMKQAFAILDELSIDCWMTFVRETSMARDPMLSFLCASDLTWHSAFLLFRDGRSVAIVGDLEKKSIEDLEVYERVLGYTEGMREPLVTLLREANPAQLALNYSPDSEIADGLTHGMYLTLLRYLEGTGLVERFLSAEPVVSRLRARKSESEVECIKRAIEHTLEIYTLVGDFLEPGLSEREIADFIRAEVDRRGLELAWEPGHCPAVFTGPDTAGAHYGPTDRRVERGHVLNMDFGVKVEGYCSDLQRTFYVLEEGETEAPQPVARGFETIRASIEKARAALKPGVEGLDVDAVARRNIVEAGYQEFPHGLGHQVGRFAHDGTALLGPAWEKYGKKPFERIEAGMVFTIEPRLTVPGRGVVTVEEMVLVADSGASYLSKPQLELILV